MTTLTVQEKLTLLPPQLLTELEDYIDFLLQKYHLQATPEPLPTTWFGMCRGDIKIQGDIISPLEVEWEVLK
jgi:Protein of unknown function (DUF2281)